MKFCGKHFACHFARKRMTQVHHMISSLPNVLLLVSCQALTNPNYTYANPQTQPEAQPPATDPRLAPFLVTPTDSTGAPLWQRRFGALIRCPKNGRLWKMICVLVCVCELILHMGAGERMCVYVACHTFFVRLLIEKCWLHEEPTRPSSAAAQWSHSWNNEYRLFS